MMEVQNSTLPGSYTYRDDGLRRLERKQSSSIKILKQDCKRLDENEAKDLALQKVLKLKQARRDYTFKLPATCKKQPPCDKEIFKNGWRVGNESEIPEQAREKMKQRSQMILVGNVYSMKNKMGRSDKMSRSKSADEVKKEMIVKSKELLNHYSQAFMKTRLNSNNFVNDLDRYHRLLLKKDRIEQDHQSGRTIPDLLPINYSNVIVEISKAEKNLNIKNSEGNLKLVNLEKKSNFPQLNSGSVCREILTLVPQQREKLVNVLRTPCSHQEYSNIEQNFRGVFDIETITKANKSACEYLDLNKACDYETKLKEETSNGFRSFDAEDATTVPVLEDEITKSLEIQLAAAHASTKLSKLGSIDEAPEDDFTKSNEILKINDSQETTQGNYRYVNNSIILEIKPSKQLEEFDKSFLELEAHFVASVRHFARYDESSKTKVHHQADLIAAFDTKKLEDLSMKKPAIQTKRRQHDSSAERMSDDESKTGISTKIDDNNGKLGDTDNSTSASTESSKQLQVSSLIDDVSASELVPTRAFDANLAYDNAMEINNNDDEKEKFELSERSRETSPSNMTWQSSNPSLEQLHKASTFTSANDIFDKKMEALRKRAGDEIKKAAEIKLQWCDSECILNEQVKQVFNFVDE